MRTLLSVLLLAIGACAQPYRPPCQELPADDAVRIREFYRLASQLQDSIWPNWSAVPAPLLLVKSDKEFLTHYPVPPKEFKPACEGFLFRSRQFQTDMLATFPAFGHASVIVIGGPEDTRSKTSTPWLITLMHEHFHQLQYSGRHYFQLVDQLGLKDGDTTGMWMLNYPFPYEKPEVASSFTALRDLLVKASSSRNLPRTKELAKRYAKARQKFFAQLTENDAKYFNFQLWQEGIARYTQIKVAEASAKYHPTAEYSALSDFKPFTGFATSAKTENLNELRQANLREWKRTVVYSFGAAEGLLLDRVNPKWKEGYFAHPFSLDWAFENLH